MKRERSDIIAFMGALCLFFATIEYLFPKPVPFFRLGLANLPVLLTLGFFKPRETMLLVALKVFGQGLINGTLASYVFLFSAAGSVTSAIVMIAVFRVFRTRISLVGVSLFGAITSNIVQIILSVTFIFGMTAWVIAPLFMVLGSASGVVVGLFAERFREQSGWLRRVESTYVATG